MKRVFLSSVIFVVSMAAGPSDVADAVMRGDTAAVKKLVEQHADASAPQADGATALHWAVFRSDKEMVDLLIRAGANAKAANRDGSTPLWLASVNGDAPIIEALIKGGADPNEKLPLGRSPLMEASRTGNVAAMKVLRYRAIVRCSGAIEPIFRTWGDSPDGCFMASNISRWLLRPDANRRP